MGSKTGLRVQTVPSLSTVSSITSETMRTPCLCEYEESEECERGLLTQQQQQLLHPKFISFKPNKGGIISRGPKAMHGAERKAASPVLGSSAYPLEH